MPTGARFRYGQTVHRLVGVSYMRVCVTESLFSDPASLWKSAEQKSDWTEARVDVTAENDYKVGR